MPGGCTGECGHREYRAANAVAVATFEGPAGQDEACAGNKADAETQALGELGRRMTAQAETIACDGGCDCFGLPAAFGPWRTLAAGRVWHGKVANGFPNVCGWKVAVTYDYQVRERLGRCYHAPPADMTAMMWEPPALAERPRARRRRQQKPA